MPTLVEGPSVEELPVSTVGDADHLPILPPAPPEEEESLVSMKPVKNKGDPASRRNGITKKWWTMYNAALVYNSNKVASHNNDNNNEESNTSSSNVSLLVDNNNNNDGDDEDNNKDTDKQNNDNLQKWIKKQRSEYWSYLINPNTLIHSMTTEKVEKLREANFTWIDDDKVFYEANMTKKIPNITTTTTNTTATTTTTKLAEGPSEGELSTIAVVGDITSVYADLVECVVVKRRKATPWTKKGSDVNAATSKKKKKGDDRNMAVLANLLLVVTAGRLGLTLAMTPESELGIQGAMIVTINAACSFRDKISPGDIIVTFNDRKVQALEDLAVETESVRKLGIVAKQVSSVTSTAKVEAQNKQRREEIITEVQQWNEKDRNIFLVEMAKRFPASYQKSFEKATQKQLTWPVELPPDFISYDGTNDVKWNTKYRELVKVRFLLMIPCYYIFFSR
jgi:hypothetical protein